MEIEKRRETSWKIQLKEDFKGLTLTSVEISGEVRIIKLSLNNGEGITEIELKKEEFFNFLSILSAFKDVVIGEDALILEEEITVIEKKPSGNNQYNIDNNVYQIEEKEQKECTDASEKQTDELNPEEWDPW